MPIRFSDFGGKVRHLKVQWEGLEVNVSYSPSNNTAANSIATQEALADEDAAQLKSVVAILQKILVGWDIMQEPNGHDKELMEPITEEFLLSLPVPFLAKMLDDISVDQSPNRRKSVR